MNGTVPELNWHRAVLLLYLDCIDYTPGKYINGGLSPTKSLTSMLRIDGSHEQPEGVFTTPFRHHNQGCKTEMA
jgi:hypothetical protein